MAGAWVALLVPLVVLLLFVVALVMGGGTYGTLMAKLTVKFFCSSLHLRSVNSVHVTSSKYSSGHLAAQVLHMRLVTLVQGWVW